MKKKMFRSMFVAAAACLVLFSCSKDDDVKGGDNSDGDGLPENETWVIFNGNADWSGGIYALKDNKAKSLNLSGIPFYQLGYAGGATVVGNKIYKRDGATTSDVGIARYGFSADGRVNEEGFVSTPNNTYETNKLIVSDTEGYYWDLGAGGMKVQTFNPSTMQRTGEIDFSSLSKGRPYESAGQYLIVKRDNKLFIDLQYGTRTQDWQINFDENKVQVAVYNLDTKLIEKVTEYEGASHIGLFTDYQVWSIDEVSKDLYILAVGFMKTQTPESKVLRIKNGEDEFDQDFELKISDYQWPTDFNRLFAYNGKIYTTISSRPTSYYGGGQHGVTYRQDIWYWNEIDAETKKAKRLSIPVDAFRSAQNPFFHNGEIYFVSNNTADNFSGVTQYNPTTGETKETFHLSESGTLMWFAIIPD